MVDRRLEAFELTTNSAPHPVKPLLGATYSVNFAMSSRATGHRGGPYPAAVERFGNPLIARNAGRPNALDDRADVRGEPIGAGAVSRLRLDGSLCASRPFITTRSNPRRAGRLSKRLTMFVELYVVRRSDDGGVSRVNC
jgi:hypothetical protein